MWYLGVSVAILYDIRCILRVWGALVRTWTESIAPLLTQYVHHIPLEPTPCISRRRWRLNHIERVHEAPCAEYDDTVYSESLRSTRLNHMYPFESYPFESYPFESYEFWIIWVLNHTREVYMMNTRIPHRRETVRLTRPGISPVGPAGVSSWILLKKECIIQKECIIKKSVLLKECIIHSLSMIKRWDFLQTSAQSAGHVSTTSLTLISPH